VSYPNAAARTVEDAVAAPLRNTLLQVNKLSDLRSRARDESAVFYLDFPFGTNPDLAFIEVNEKIDQAMDKLPREVLRPRVLASDVSDIPVVQLSVSLRDTNTDDRATAMLELSALARNVLRRRLEQLPEVAFADRSGQLVPRLVVRPRTESLRALGLTESDLAELLRSANVELGGLLLADGHYEYAVRFTGNLRSAADLRRLYLRLEGGRTIALTDIATVSYEATPPRGLYFHDGHPGVVFTLRKRAAARMFDLRENLQVLLADLEREYPRLRFHFNNDQTAILRASIDNLSGGLSYGAGFAILILFVFFREWRRPLLIGLAVPVALLIAVLGFYFVDISINVISLAGLILGLGLMIDNSIIVLDNIAQHGTKDRATIAKATNEVIRPLITSALTTVAVFLPLILLSGIAGALFRDQAIAVTLSLTASLLVAYFLLPTLNWLFRRKEYNKARPVAENIGIAEKVKSKISNRNSWQILFPFTLLVLWFAVGYLLLQQIPSQGFPSLSRTDYQLEVEWNEA
ncbi:MAG: efflux RND transporter permease subunit, partial [Bacteroidota bacterium]